MPLCTTLHRLRCAALEAFRARSEAVRITVGAGPVARTRFVSAAAAAAVVAAATEAAAVVLPTTASEAASASRPTVATCSVMVTTTTVAATRRQCRIRVGRRLVEAGLGAACGRLGFRRQLDLRGSSSRLGRQHVLHPFLDVVHPGLAFRRATDQYFQLTRVAEAQQLRTIQTGGSAGNATTLLD